MLQSPLSPELAGQGHSSLRRLCTTTAYLIHTAFGTLLPFRPPIPVCDLVLYMRVSDTLPPTRACQLACPQSEV
jgi:hypothetical protein